MWEKDYHKLFVPAHSSFLLRYLTGEWFTALIYAEFPIHKRYLLRNTLIDKPDCSSHYKMLYANRNLQAYYELIFHIDSFKDLYAEDQKLFWFKHNLIFGGINSFYGDKSKYKSSEHLKKANQMFAEALNIGAKVKKNNTDEYSEFLLLYGTLLSYSEQYSDSLDIYRKYINTDNLRSSKWGLIANLEKVVSTDRADFSTRFDAATMLTTIYLLYLTGNSTGVLFLILCACLLIVLAVHLLRDSANRVKYAVISLIQTSVFFVMYLYLSSPFHFFVFFALATYILLWIYQAVTGNEVRKLSLFSISLTVVLSLPGTYLQIVGNFLNFIFFITLSAIVISIFLYTVLKLNKSTSIYTSIVLSTVIYQLISFDSFHQNYYGSLTMQTIFMISVLSISLLIVSKTGRRSSFYFITVLLFFYSIFIIINLLPVRNLSFFYNVDDCVEPFFAIFMKMVLMGIFTLITCRIFEDIVVTASSTNHSFFKYREWFIYKSLLLVLPILTGLLLFFMKPAIWSYLLYRSEYSSQIIYLFTELHTSILGVLN